MHPSRAALLAVSAVLLLTGTACESGEAGTDPGDTRPVRLYGTDGNMSNSFGDQFESSPGMLDGMKGTAPLTPLTDEFRDRLRSVDGSLEDFLYAAETYDAVVISALAAELAGTTQSRQIARYVNGVTTGGTLCDAVADCLRLAREGTDIQYRGVSLRRGGFTDAGEPATASYATLHFGGSDRLDDAKTEFVGAGDEATTTQQRSPAPRKRNNSNAPLKLGGLLPKTGALALQLPPMTAGAALAIREINAAGGVLDEPVQWIDGDDGTSPDVAARTVDAHIARGVHVIIGAGASGVSRAVLPRVVDAGIILFSPCNTAADLSTVDDRGLYFRTAPSDLLQGKALADVIMRDAVQRVAIVARDDSYGAGLQEVVRAELERAGVPTTDILTTKYPATDEEQIDFASGAQGIRQFAPDAVLIIGFGESASVIKALDAAGLPLQG